MAIPPTATRHQRAFGFSIWRQRVAAMDAFHSHADIEINHLHAGTLSCIVGGRMVDLGPGDAVAFWGAIPHRVLSASTGAEGVWATVPPGRGDPAIERRLTSGACLLGRRIDLGRSAGWPADLASGEVRSRAAELELMAMLLRLTPAAGPVRPRASRGDAAAQAAAMASCMAAGLDRQLAVADIADAAGLNPRYAQAVFRSVVGTSIWDYLLRLRIAHAQSLLRTRPDLDVLQVALASGFGSPGRFHAAFRRFAGLTPAAWRKAL